jgi:hypothetical protein
MAVATVSDCLSGLDREKIDGLCLATTDPNKLAKVKKS